MTEDKDKEYGRARPKSGRARRRYIGADRTAADAIHNKREPADVTDLLRRVCVEMGHSGEDFQRLLRALARMDVRDPVRYTRRMGNASISEIIQLSKAREAIGRDGKR